MNYLNIQRLYNQWLITTHHDGRLVRVWNLIQMEPSWIFLLLFSNPVLRISFEQKYESFHVISNYETSHKFLKPPRKWALGQEIFCMFHFFWSVEENEVEILCKKRNRSVLMFLLPFKNTVILWREFLTSQYLWYSKNLYPCCR